MNGTRHKEYTERQLIAALKGGEQNAMEEVYERYSKALFTVIYRVVENQEMAEDVLQESFLKIWNGIAQYDETRGTLFTWMLNICRNRAIDKTRSAEFKKSAKNQSLGASVSLLNDRTEFNPETLGLKAMTERLKPEQREIIDLVYFNGYTHMEVSEELNLPLGTVKIRLRAAINELRNYFK